MPRASMSASTACSAPRLPWTSEIRAIRSSATASVDLLAQPGDVATLSFGSARCLADHGCTGLTDDVGQVVTLDPTGSEVRVPVGTRVELVTGVVGVHEVDASGDGADLVD